MTDKLKAKRTALIAEFNECRSVAQEHQTAATQKLDRAKFLAGAIAALNETIAEVEAAEAECVIVPVKEPEPEPVPPVASEG